MKHKITSILICTILFSICCSAQQFYLFKQKTAPIGYNSKDTARVYTFDLKTEKEKYVATIYHRFNYYCNLDSTWFDTRLDTIDFKNDKNDKTAFPFLSSDGFAQKEKDILYNLFYSPIPIVEAGLYKINLKTRQRYFVGKLPFANPNFYATNQALLFYNHELIVFTNSEVTQIDTINPINSKILFDLPLPLATFNTNVIEECDTSRIISFTQWEGIVELDWNKKKFIKISDYDYKKGYYFATVEAPPQYLSCLDLDKNNSTTNRPKDYHNSLCTGGSGSVSICDSDIKVKTRPGFADSMRVWISSGIKDIGSEQLTLVGALPAGVSQKTKNGEWWFYFPKDYAEANIENLIKQIRYTNSKATPTLGERQITFYLYTAKVVSDPAVAHIFISKPQTSKQDYSACTGKILTINGINIKKDTSFCTALKGKEGCDSTHCVTVTFSAKQSGTAKQNVCFGETYIFKGITYSKSGVYKDTLKSSQGCDSIVAYTFSVLPKKEGTTKASICFGQSYDFYGKNLSQGGDYEHVINAVNVCDSTVKLTLSVLPKKEGSAKASICFGQSYDFYGKNLTQSGDYEHVISAANACDSTVKLTLSVLPKKEGATKASICFGQSYDFYGKNLTQGGDYEHVVSAANVCDSTVKLTLSILSKKEGAIKGSVCFGQSYDFYGKNLTQSGDYEHVVNTVNACDSTVKLTLSILPKKEGTAKASICFGQTYDFYGKNLTQSGDYEHVINAANVCDSTVKLMLSVLPKKEILRKATTCEGVAYNFYGDVLTKSGNYEKMFKTKMGCDSLEKLSLQVVTLPILTLPTDITLTEGTSVKIKATVKADSLKSIAWLPATFLDKDDALEVTTTPTENIDYQVVVKNKNGCEAKASIKVFLKAKKKIFTPTAFSPNEDGFNDLFEVFLKADEGAVESYEIYDRWGNLIYQNAEPWSGKDSSEGVYTYLVKVKWNDGKVSALSGDVTLTR